MPSVCPFCGKESESSDSRFTCSNRDCENLIDTNDWYFHDCHSIEGDLEYHYTKETNPKQKDEILDFERIDENIILIKTNFSWTTVNRVGSDSQFVAVFHKNKRDNTWYLFTLCESIKVNGEYKRNQKISNGDNLTFNKCFAKYENSKLIFASEKRNKGVNVSIKGLYAKIKTSKKYLLSGIDLEISSGSFVGIVGPSGCGKSSLIQRIIGLADYSSGSIKIDGKECKENKKEIHKNSAYLPQAVEEMLHSDLTIKQEIDCYCDIHCISRKDLNLDDVFYKPLELCRDNYENKKIKALSGGEKRRVALGLILLRNPKLILLDEPTAGLDFATEDSIMHLLKKFSQQGRTVICSTHVLENVKLFDKVLALTGGEHSGKVAYFGNPSQLLNGVGVGSFVALYQELTKLNPQVSSPVDRNSEKENKSKQNFKFSKEALKQFFISCKGYVKRSFIDFNIWKTICNVLFQPIFVAIAVPIACRYKYYHCDGSFETIAFCCCLAMLWMGMMGSVRKFVEERIPKRCVERLNCVSTRQYIVAAILELTIKSIIYAIVFSLVFFVLSNESFIGKHNNCVGGAILSEHFLLVKVSFQNIDVVISTLLVLFTMAFLGGIIGLAISSFSKKNISAIICATIFTISALFFSLPVVGSCSNRKGNDDIPIKISKIMPCHYGYKYLTEAIQRYQKPGEPSPKECSLVKFYIDPSKESPASDVPCKEELPNPFVNLKKFLFNTSIWILISVITISIFQAYHEKKWDGR